MPRWPDLMWSSIADELRARIGLTGQYAAVDENLTGFENLEMFGQLYHLSGCSRPTPC